MPLAARRVGTPRSRRPRPSLVPQPSSEPRPSCRTVSPAARIVVRTARDATG